MSLFPDFERVYPPNEPVVGSPTTWIFLHGRSVLVQTDSGDPVLPSGAAPAELEKKCTEPLLIGRLSTVDFVMVEVDEGAAAPEGWQDLDLRSLYGRIPEVEWFVVGYASQVAHWRRTSGFCPICGQPMGPMGVEWRRRCTACDHERYPIVSPAVLALVHDGADQVLLAHKPGWGQRRSILAGFTLPGESLEECVHREVLEEAGVRVTDLVYYGSQPWPFPHQLMIGFFSRHVSGKIIIDAEELEGADWYDYRDLPPLPPPLSLSRQMIDAWAASRRSAAAVVSSGGS